MRAFMFGKGRGEEIDPNEPPIPVGSALVFTSYNFPGIIPICSDVAVIYSTTTRLQQNVITWLNTRTRSITNLGYMNYTVAVGLNGTAPNGYYRFSGGRNIIRLSGGVVQSVTYCQ